MNLVFISARQSLRDSGYLLACLLSAVVCAAAVSGVPIYSDAIEALGVRRMADSTPPSATGAWVHAPEVAFNPAAIAATNGVLDRAGELLGGLTNGKTVFTRSGVLSARSDSPVATVSPRSWHYRSIVGDAPDIRYVSGSRPSEGASVEVALSAAVAEELGINVGDSFQLTVPPTDILHSIATVTGTWEPVDEGGVYWQGLYKSLMDPEQGATGGAPPTIALTSHQTLIRLATDSIADLGEVWALYYTDPVALRRVEIDGTVASLERFRNHIANELPDSRVVSGIQSALGTLRRQLAFANVSTRVAGTLFAAFMVFVIFVLARMVTKLRDRDRAGLEARGADRAQVVKTFFLHGMILAAIPAVVGPSISAALLPQLGRTSGFAQITGGQPFAWSMTSEQFAFSSGISAMVTLYFFLPVAASTIGPMLNTATRGLRSSPWIWRANLDLLLIVASLALIYEANSHGALVGNDGTITAVSALLPVAAATVAALAALRAMSLIGAVFSVLGRNKWFPNLATTAKTFSRAVMSHATPTLVAAGVTVVALTSLGLQDTLSRNASDRALYEAIADVRFAGIDGYQREFNRDVQRIQDLGWIRETAWGIRSSGSAGATEAATGFDLLAVQPERFGRLAWFRPDFAMGEPVELLDSISLYAKPDGLAIPVNASRLFLDAELVQHGSGSGRIDLWTRVADGTGRTHTLQMEPDDASISMIGKRWTSAIDPGLQHPITILGIEVYEPPVSPLGNPATLTLHTLGTLSSGGQEHSITDFSDVSAWHPMASAPTGSTTIDARGDSIVVLMGPGNDDGIRGIYHSSSGPLEVPLLVNRAFIDESGLAVDESFTGQTLGRYVPFVIRDTYEFFSSFPNPNRPNAVANVTALLDYIEPVAEPFLGNSAELIATVEESESPDVRRSDIKTINPAISVFDRESIFVNASGGLASITGWRYIGRVVTILATVAGALTLFAFGVRLVNEERRDRAVLESIGSTRASNRLDLVFRLGFPALFGLMAVGLPSGFYGIQWFAQNMVHTEEGSVAVPPLAMQIEWASVATVAIVTFIAAVLPAFLDRSRGRVSIAARIRSEPAI